MREIRAVNVRTGEDKLLLSTNLPHQVLDEFSKKAPREIEAGRLEFVKQCKRLLRNLADNRRPLTPDESWGGLLACPSQRRASCQLSVSSTIIQHRHKSLHRHNVMFQIPRSTRPRLFDGRRRRGTDARARQPNRNPPPQRHGPKPARPCHGPRRLRARDRRVAQNRWRQLPWEEFQSTHSKIAALVAEFGRLYPHDPRIATSCLKGGRLFPISVGGRRRTPRSAKSFRRPTIRVKRKPYLLKPSSKSRNRSTTR